MISDNIQRRVPISREASFNPRPAWLAEAVMDVALSKCRALFRALNVV